MSGNNFKVLPLLPPLGKLNRKLSQTFRRNEMLENVTPATVLLLT